MVFDHCEPLLLGVCADPRVGLALARARRKRRSARTAKVQTGTGRTVAPHTRLGSASFIPSWLAAKPSDS